MPHLNISCIVSFRHYHLFGSSSEELPLSSCLIQSLKWNETKHWFSGHQILLHFLPDPVHDRFAEMYHVRMTGYDDGSPFESGVEARTLAYRLHKNGDLKAFKDRRQKLEVNSLNCKRPFHINRLYKPCFAQHPTLLQRSFIYPNHSRY